MQNISKEIVDLDAPETAVSREICLEQLVNERVDIKRWINASLQGLLPPIVNITEDDAVVEACVVKLLNKLQSHLHEVSGSVEETIAQALVRLPRTGLEVGRMVTEAQQLQEQLQGINNTMQCAVEAAAKPYVAQLTALKKIEEKLNRCADTLQKASQVDSNMKQLDDFMQQLRTAPAEVDMNAVAEAISHVRRNLAELQKLDVTFDEKQLEEVERYEQAVQRAVEAECLELMLQQRNVNRARHLLNVLEIIGRVDVVLQQYALESIVNERKLVEELFPANSTVTMSCSRAAKVLKQELIPFISNLLTDKLDYLVRMVKPEERASEKSLCNSLFSLSSPNLAETRALKVLQLMVVEMKGNIAPALQPILEEAEENNDLIACCDAIRELKVKTGVGIYKSDSTNNKNNIDDEKTLLLVEKLSSQITVYAIFEMIELCSKPNILEAFARRESCNVRARLTGSQNLLKRELFREVMDAVTNGVKNIVRFFPEKTLPMSVERWREALLESISRLQPTTQISQEILLERLSFTSAVLRQLILSAKTTENYLTSPELQQLHPTLAETMNTQLWKPLEGAIENCAKECQQALKRTIIEPVIAKAAGYDLQHLWGSRENNGDCPNVESFPPVQLAVAQVAPSEFVRALGEAIVEIPLTLEALRGDGDFGARHDDIEDLLEEVVSFWLDDIVQAAVTDFMENKVGRIKIYFPVNVPEAAKKEAAAVEQLITDLNYLKSILLAVSCDPFEMLERPLARLKAVALPSGKPIVIRQLIS